MHVCIIVRRINSLDGVATHARDLARYLKKKNIRLTVMAVDVIPGTSDNVTYIWTRPFQEYRNRLNPRNMAIPAVSLFKKIISTHLRDHIDIFHVIDSMAFAVINIFSKLFRVPNVFTVQALSCANSQTSPDPPDVDKLYLKANKHVARNASSVLCVSDAILQLMSQWGAETSRLHLVPNLIDTENIRPSHLVQRASETCVFVGSLLSIKGVDNLLRAVPHVMERRPNASFVIVGDGTERKKLLDIADHLSINSHVRFIGAVPKQEVSQWYQQARVMILPSLNEGLPNVILEAFAHGLPVVASNVGGIPDVVRNGWNGFLAPPGDAKALADGICRLLENDSLHKQCSANALQTAENYSWTKGIDHILDIYSGIRL